MGLSLSSQIGHTKVSKLEKYLQVSFADISFTILSFELQWHEVLLSFSTSIDERILFLGFMLRMIFTVWLRTHLYNQSNCQWTKIYLVYYHSATFYHNNCTNTKLYCNLLYYSIVLHCSFHSAILFALLYISHIVYSIRYFIIHT